MRLLTSCSSMRPIFLIRHAKVTVDPSVDSKLWQLEAGARDRCKTLAEKLKGTGLNRIVTSEESKAKETGRFVAETLDIPCQSAPNLHEHERTGVPFMGKQTWSRTMMDFFRKQDKLIFGTETANQAKERFDQAVREVLRRYQDETLAICSHGTVMSLFVAHYNPVDALEFWQSLEMPDVVALSIETFELLP